MLELIGAFVAGVLTTLAPRAFQPLPVIVGGSLALPSDEGAVDGGARSRSPSAPGGRRVGAPS